MKLVSEHDVVKTRDDKRNSKKRYLTTDGVCFRCGAIVNYNFQLRCILCCGSEEFLVGEYGQVLRELLELDIEKLKAICELRGISGCSRSRSRMVLGLFKVIFPKLTKVDSRIDEMLISKIITRNRKKFWFVRDIEEAICSIRRNSNKAVCNKQTGGADTVGYMLSRNRKNNNMLYTGVNIKFIDAKDMVQD